MDLDGCDIVFMAMELCERVYLGCIIQGTW